MARGQGEPEERPRRSALRLVATQGKHEQDNLADADRDVGAGEDVGSIAERLGQCDRHHQAAEHAPDNQQLYLRSPRVVQVGDPRREGPDQPDS
jgi:hypothetical protein